MSFAHTLGQDDTVFVNLRGMQVRIEVGSGNEMTVRSKPTVYLNPRGHGVFSLETIKRQLPGVSARNISVQASGGSVAAAVINGAVSLGSGGPKVQQALTTITLNAAKLLRIQDRVGSLEAGKDADFVVWNGDPLSQFTKAEQTWVDGRRYFSLEEDAARRVQVDKERRQLIQAVLAASGSQPRAATSGRN